MALKCSNAGPDPRRNCRGANHVPPCAKYLAAVGQFAPPPARGKRNGSGKHRIDPATGKRATDRLSDEEKAKVSRENGAKGGRPEGVKNILPTGALTVLRKGKFRVQAEILAAAEAGDPEAKAVVDLAGYSMERLGMLIAGRVKSRVAPSVMKGIDRLRDEVCEPIVRKSEVRGALDLGKALDAAEQARKEGAK